MTDDETLGIADQPATLDLQFAKPLTLGGVEWPSVTLREPTVHEVLRCTATGSAIEQMQALISAVGAIPKAALNAMPVSAYRKAEAFLMGFLSDGEDEAPTPDGERPESFSIETVNSAGEPVSLVIAEPTLTMMREAGRAGGALAQQIKLMSLAANCSTDEIDKLRFSDFAKGRQFLLSF